MISVAMTTYNGEKYLRKQIESVLNQTQKVDEIIVCDDGSTDNTIKILNDYPVKVYLNSQNLGYKLNFKKAMELCNGDYIFLCDQDDVWEENKVEEMLKIMQSNDAIHVLASSFTYIEGNDKIIETKNERNHSNNNLYPKDVKGNELVSVLFDEYLSGNYFQGCSLVMDRWIKDLVLKDFDTRIPHDWLISMVAASYDGMYFYNKSLFKYRIHEQNTLGIESLNQSTKDHFKSALILNVRLQDAKDALVVLDILSRLNSVYYQKREKEFRNLSLFLVEHNDNLKNKRFFKLLKQNFNPFYGIIRTYKARIMDLFFCLYPNR